MFECIYCNRKYKTEKKYNDHIEIHLNDKKSKEIEISNTNIRISKNVKKYEFHICPICPKKYKTEKTLETHIENKHYYETRKGSNNFRFTHEERIKIYDLLIKYKDIVINKENTENIVKNLIPQDVNPSSEKITCMLKTHEIFIQKFISSNMLETCNWINVIDDFGKFLALGLPYYDTNFNPSLEIDFVWHAVMQDKDFYEKICKDKALCLVPHCEIERTEDQDKQRYQYFLDVFEHTYRHKLNNISTETCFSIEKSKCEEENKFLEQELLEKERFEKEKLQIQLNREKYNAFKKSQNEKWSLFWKKAGLDREGEPPFAVKEYYINLVNEGYTGIKLINEADRLYRANWRASSC